MRYLVVASLVAVQIFATMILNLNVKERANSIELLLNFDVPYQGSIVKKRAKDRIDLILKRVRILAPWQKKLSSKIAYQIDVKPLGNDTLISFYTTASPQLYAARSKDGFSLKIELKNVVPASTKTEKSFDLASLKKPALWAIGTLGALLLLVLGIKLLRSGKAEETKRIVVENPTTPEFQIIFEKPLDGKNKIALIQHKGIQYLVIIGSTNVLLGKYKEGEIESPEDFERAIQNQDLSQAVKPKEQEEIFTTIEEYKRRASGDL